MHCLDACKTLHPTGFEPARTECPDDLKSSPLDHSGTDAELLRVVTSLSCSRRSDLAYIISTYLLPTMPRMASTAQPYHHFRTYEYTPIIFNLMSNFQYSQLSNFLMQT